MQPRRGEEGRGGGEWRGGEERGGKGRGEGEGTGERGESGKRRGGKGGVQGRCNRVSKERPTKPGTKRRDEYREATNPHDEREECTRVSKESKSNLPGRGQPEGRKGGAGGEGQAGKRESSRQSQQAVRLFSAPVDQSDVRTSPYGANPGWRQGPTARDQRIRPRMKPIRRAAGGRAASAEHGEEVGRAQVSRPSQHQLGTQAQACRC